MALIARTLGVSVLTSVLAAGVGIVLFGGTRDGTGIALLLGCVGGIIGAIAGAAREIVRRNENVLNH
jgi:hypothetical protein